MDNQLGKKYLQVFVLLQRSLTYLSRLKNYENIM